MTLTAQHLQSLFSSISEVMSRDHYRLQRQLHDWQQYLKHKKPIPADQYENFLQAIARSTQEKQQRILNCPVPAFPEELPISMHREQIGELIKQHQVVVIAGETGSGKTTQLPKICLSIGRGMRGFIGCTQPRRIAARSIAQRIAEELNHPLGHAVGYKVRFTDRTSPQSYIKLMTDGILLAETQNDRFLEHYDTLIIDEAHERNLNIDFLLGYLKQILSKRPDLKLIITSATIDTQRFSTHFNNAPILEISGRTYPVELRYRPLMNEDEEQQDRDLQQAIIDAVEEINQHDRQANILIFLPGEREIRETTDALSKHKWLNTELLPLYSRLSVNEQNRVFSPSQKRRIVLATNVAETSLTVPGIKAVIDPGLARISRYSVRNKVQRLPIEKISRSSADQRKGRCGRIAPGLCIRLYSELDYQQRPEFTEPELLRTSLASVILQMLSLHLGDIYHFPFVEMPTPKMINDGFTLLIELGAVNAKRQLTELGKQLARLPIDPRIGRMILAAKEEHCLTEMLIIASALSIQDPRERPLDAAAAADAAQLAFMDERSDFLSFLKLWTAYEQQSQHLSNNKLRQWCHDHFISYLRMREWHDIHQQLKTLVRESGWILNQIEADYIALHRCLLSGLLGNVATKSMEDYYQGTRGLKIYVFPGSSLFKKQPKWLLASELVETSKLYARCVAKIEPEWVEQVAGDLCQRHYFEPHWQKRTGQVGAFERVTLYGLTLVAKRRINYGPKDPVLAREIFIREGLVAGEVLTNAAFFRHNQQLIQEIQELEHKVRRQDILVDEQQLFAFYDARIPEGIYNIHDFEQWRKLAEKDNPKLLFLTHDDVVSHSNHQIARQQFPDHLQLHGVSLPLSYHFEPGHDRDGVTVTIPTSLLNQLTPTPFEWLVPGLLEEKITALIRSLPKALRRHFVPVPDVAKAATLALMEKMGNPHTPTGSLLTELTLFLQRHLGEPLPEKPFHLDSLPVHLNMNFLLVDTEDRALTLSRDLLQLKAKWGDQASAECQKVIAAHSGIERTHLTRWDFGELPPQVSLMLNGIDIPGFPTLLDQKTHVDLKVVDSPQQAEHLFYAGLRRLFLLNLPLKSLLKQLPIDHRLCLQYSKIGRCEDLKQELLEKLVETLFLTAPLPRNAQAFLQRLQTGQPRLLPLAAETAQQLIKIFDIYHELTQNLNKSNSAPPHPALAEIRAHLDTLIYPHFIRDMPLSQMNHLARYLKAILIRLERLTHSPHNDAKRATQMERYWSAFRSTREQLKATPEQIEQFRWLLEELRVSLFAQELKTAVPVSIERVDKLWAELKQIR
jgi:ATP-dependent helicase HrpA